MLHQGFEMYGSDKSFLSFCKNQTLFESAKTDIIISREGPLSKELNKSPYQLFYYGMGRLPIHVIKKNPFKYLLIFFKDLFTALTVLRGYEFVYINTIAPMAWIVASAILNKRRCIHIREIPKARITLLISLFLVKNCKVIFNSSETQRHFKSFFHLNKTFVNNGVKEMELDHNESNGYSDIFKEGCFNVLIPGRINSWKGQDFILESIKKYGPIYENINWIFAGDVALDQEWRYRELKKIIDYDSVDNIHFLGWRNDLANLMFYSDLVIVPSVKPEPFGRVVIESMSIGKIVLASNHGGPSKIITDGVNGFVFHPLNDQSFRDKLISVKNLNNADKKVIETAAKKEFQHKYSEKIYLNNLVNELKKHFIKYN